MEWNEQDYNEKIARVKSDISKIDKEYHYNNKKLNAIIDRQRQLGRKKGKMTAYLNTITKNKNIMFNDKG